MQGLSRALRVALLLPLTSVAAEAQVRFYISPTSVLATQAQMAALVSIGDQVDKDEKALDAQVPITSTTSASSSQAVLLRARLFLSSTGEPQGNIEGSSEGVVRSEVQGTTSSIRVELSSDMDLAASIDLEREHPPYMQHQVDLDHLLPSGMGTPLQTQVPFLVIEDGLEFAPGSGGFLLTRTEGGDSGGESWLEFELMQDLDQDGSIGPFDVPAGPASLLYVPGIPFTTTQSSLLFDPIPVDRGWYVLRLGLTTYTEAELKGWDGPGLPAVLFSNSEVQGKIEGGF